MNEELLKILACPYDRFDLELRDFISSGEEIISGKLICKSCGREYHIRNSIPNFLVCMEIDNKHWKRGERVWNKDFISKVLTKLKVKENEIVTEGFTLDVGCGENPRGDVNLDCYIPSRIPKNFILGSAEKLPFKEKSFDVIRSSYVIEHLLDPVNFIRQCVDMAKKKVIIITDNSDWLGEIFFRLVGSGRIFHDEHYYKWSVEYMRNLLKRLGLNATVKPCNLSPTLIVKLLSSLGILPRIGVLFYRDIYVEVRTSR